ncbi:hypothetical protein PM8797T_13228 [Gimesia maris DSM 8797]|nr:hypothetical protein PM8797T_13228 [Gimesia maris DSM 8797]
MARAGHRKREVVKKKIIRQFIEIFEKSFEFKPKKLDAEWRAIHASANVLMVRYNLYVKPGKKRTRAY